MRLALVANHTAIVAWTRKLTSPGVFGYRTGTGMSISLHTAGSAQRTFSVAMALLGAVAAAQVLGVLYFLTRHRNEGTTSAFRNAAEARLFEPSRPDAAPGATKPVQLPAVQGVPPTTLLPSQKPPQSVAETLLRLAKSARERGDTADAISKLQQGTALDPGNAEILAELALTYESIQVVDRSNEVWRRLQSLGPSAGPLYELANLKLRVGVAPPHSNSPKSNAAETNKALDIPEGSTFGISELTLKSLIDPDAESKLVLRVGVKVRPDTEIDHTKVKIQVFFYDILNNDRVVLTDADVSYEWVTPGHDWADTGTEVLDVTYVRQKRADSHPGSVMPAEVPDSVEKAQLSARKRQKKPELSNEDESGPRQFLGYIVRLYYKDQLQEVRADPARLLNLFPPPVTAPSQ